MQLYDVRIAVALVLINAEAPSSDLSSDSDSEPQAEPRRGRVSALPDRSFRVPSINHMPIAVTSRTLPDAYLRAARARAV